MPPIAAIGHALLRRLYRSGLDVLVLTALFSWGYAVFRKEIPYVPWEYPCAAAVCAWSVIVNQRSRLRGSQHPALLIPFLSAIVLLTCFTAVSFLPYLVPASWLLGFVLLGRRLPRVTLGILYMAVSLAALAPAVFLEFRYPFYRILSGCGFWPLGFFVLLLLHEHIGSRAAARCAKR